jgi:HEAT repeat protein
MAVELKEDLKALDSGDARLRRSAENHILTLGGRVCRALGREVKARTESGDTGPGYVCLLRLLGAVGIPEAWRPLCVAATKHALAPSVRVEAIRALGTLGTAEGVDPLVECAGEGEPMALRLAAIKALAPFADREAARTALLSHLALGAPPIRESAAKALQGCRDRGVRDHFLARLVDGHSGVRLLAVSYFLRHPSPKAASPLKSLAASDSDLRVVVAAGRALEALGNKTE